MKSKEKTGNIYYITDVDRTPDYVEVIKDLNISNITNVCIICGNSTGNITSMVCDECKEAIKWAKRCMSVAKEQQENTLKESKTMCPHCGSFNTQLMYGTATLYDYDKDGHSLTEHFTCKDCHKEFDISTK